MATDIENGTEIIRAKKEVINVPTKNGTAPKIFETGFQTLVVKKLIPNSFIAGKDSTNKVNKIASTTMINITPTDRSNFLKNFSEKFGKVLF
jgi:hypothetical protein